MEPATKTEAIKEGMRDLAGHNAYARAMLRHIEEADDQDAAVEQIERCAVAVGRKLHDIFRSLPALTRLKLLLADARQRGS